MEQNPTTGGEREREEPLFSTLSVSLLRAELSGEQGTLPRSVKTAAVFPLYA